MLTKRIWSALAAGVFVLLALLFGNAEVWRGVVWIATLIAAYEFAFMFQQSWRSPLTWWSFVIVTVVQVWRGWHGEIGLYVFAGATLLIPVLWRNRVDVSHAATVFLGSFYIAIGGLSLERIRAMPNGLEWVLLVLITVWSTDTVAYFAGTYLRGPKLWPDISPKKTVSGAVCGILGAALAAVLVHAVAGPGGGHWLSFAAVGAGISVFSQFGDLVESAYKRSAGVKDSGKLMPGHGGLLDRIDGLLFSAPFAWLLLAAGVLAGTR